MHLLAAFRIQERFRMLSTPFRAWSSMVFSSGWRQRPSSPAATVSKPSMPPENQGVLPTMMLHNRVRGLCVVLAASAVFAFSSPAFSQDVTESHLKAARAAVAAIHATDPFDNILPQAAAALESQLIQKNPDMQELIGKTINEKALALASRRADLEKEAALAYAKVFSEKELNEI